MRFLVIFKSANAERPPSEQEVARMGPFIEESMKAGILLVAEGCKPSSSGARVRRTNGNYAVTDGPFIETKEVIGGFAIIERPSIEAAIEFTKRFMDIASDGETEIRQLYEVPATG